MVSFRAAVFKALQQEARRIEKDLIALRRHLHRNPEPRWAEWKTSALVAQRLKDLGLEVKSIVLTHSHIDHVGALREAKEATNAEVVIHADDAMSLQARRPVGTVSRLSLQSPPTPDRLLKDGDSIDIGSLHFSVLHTPGHSPGGICLLGEGVVFTGDTLFNFSIGRYDTPGGSYGYLMESIHAKLMVLPDNTVVYPGHGPKSTIGIERQWNPYLRD